MLSFKEFLIEAKEHGRFVHGTIIDHIPSIKQNWLQPKVGHFVKKMYGDDAQQPSVFLAHENDMKRAHVAMTYHIANKLGKSMHKVTLDDVENHGALVIHSPKSEWNKPNYYNPEEGHEPDDRPVGAESGDYYSHEDVEPTGFLTGKPLRKFIEKRGFMKS